MTPLPGFGNCPGYARASHYLPRLRREFYQADARVFWTLPIAGRAQGWLDRDFHGAFREMMLHSADREGLLCPAYCLMPDHLHLVWMGLRQDTDQLNGMKFVRRELAPFLLPAHFQHQAYDHVLTKAENEQRAFTVACTEYVLLNPLRAGLVNSPQEWPYQGAVVPGYPRLNPLESEFWPWYWQHYGEVREEGLEQRVLPPRELA